MWSEVQNLENLLGIYEEDSLSGKQDGSQASRRVTAAELDPTLFA